MIKPLAGFTVLDFSQFLAGPFASLRLADLGAQVILKRKWEKKHWQEYYDRGGKTL